MIAVNLLAAACTPSAQNSAFDPKTCMETVPRHVKGLEIIQGPRTEQSIIRDMVPVVCNAQVLFRRMQASGENLGDGTVVFRVTVEYTGEVNNASIVKTTLTDDQFLREVADFIMDTDFVGWVRHDTETVFLYPMAFGRQP